MLQDSCEGSERTFSPYVVKPIGAPHELQEAPLELFEPQNSKPPSLQPPSPQPLTLAPFHFHFDLPLSSPLQRWSTLASAILCQWLVRGSCWRSVPLPPLPSHCPAGAVFDARAMTGDGRSHDNSVGRDVRRPST